MTPTNDQLNRKTYEVINGCAHLDMKRGEHYQMICRQCGKTFVQYPHYPDFCTDRNALPQLWAKVEATEAVCQYGREIHALTKSDSRIQPAWWIYQTATPRQHTIAALKALDAWPEDWEDGS